MISFLNHKPAVSFGTIYKTNNAKTSAKNFSKVYSLKKSPLLHKIKVDKTFYIFDGIDAEKYSEQTNNSPRIQSNKFKLNFIKNQTSGGSKVINLDE